ncbi:hypothetical protein MGYG_03050 [Nannizzia gypsea CBS 118893]|uniref:Uncharacterized protein n=1 Tax=Arthroderma gypseum (strain ATCC MYA-4604 / CBS 118893) TaxID=535722 RepID=E4UQH4_ARTGP|nr:hypothetical protein MGYG_03050 [Nannizzia gypsea CBS 118893]EFR00044.1 hypothetical protein MGYG_03050 [Nannizzia gypsea CBS 118893]
MDVTMHGRFLFGSKGSSEEEKDERTGYWPFPQAPSSFYIPAVSHINPPSRRKTWFHPGVKEAVTSHSLDKGSTPCLELYLTFNTIRMCIR